jgi:hypothetical protein
VRAPFGFAALVTGGVGTAGTRADLEGLDLTREPPGALPGLLALDAPRAFHAATLFGFGQVLLSGGRDGNLVLDSSTLYFQNVGFVSTPIEGQARAPRWPHMNSPRVGHTQSFLPDSRMLVVGGVDHRGVVVAGAETFLGAAFR